MTPLFGGKKGGGEPSGGDGGPRSAAQREAARLDRERRRAEREGRPLPPEPAPSDGTGNMAVDDLWSAEPEAVPPAPAYEPAPAPDPAPPAADPGGQTPYHAETEIFSSEPQGGGLTPEAPAPAYEAPPVEPATQAYEAEPRIEVPFEPVYETVPPAEEPQYTEDYAAVEAPAGVRRVPAPSVADLPAVGGPRPTPPGPVRGPAADRKAGRPRGVPRGRRGITRLIPIVFLLVVLAIGYFAYRVFQPGHGDGDAKQPVAVVIPQGATAGEIADQLQKAGVIDSTFYFNIRSRLSGQRGDLKAGRFTLRKDMSYTAAMDALSKNPAAAPTASVTIPEGRSIREAAPLVRQAGLTGSYAKAAAKNPRTVPGFRQYGVPKGTRTMEGFLFPATYELKRGAKTATAAALVDQQLRAFRDNYNKLDRRAAKRKNLSDYDVLIIASMIEREAEVAKERRLISAVIYNRLQQSIPLGIDATLRYDLKNWSRPLRQSELQRDTPFNTRTRKGLPPTPIGSPGLASIKAALNPAKVPYIFYVVKPCGEGTHAFSASDAQFQRDVAAYNKKRDQLGGKDPSSC